METFERLSRRNGRPRKIGLLAVGGLFVLLLSAAPSWASAQKAKTIDELVEMFDSTRCAACHEEIYDQWEKSQHSRPLVGIPGLINMRSMAMPGQTPFSPDTPEQATIATYSPCFKCHLPQAMTHAEDSVAVELTQALLAKDADKLGKLQITCLVCHNSMAITHKLEDGEPGAHTLYSSHAVPGHEDAVFTEVEKSPIMNRSIMCGQCHGLGPNLEFGNPVQCATLYGSYLHAYIPAGGTETCQSCHMKPVDGKANHLFAPNWNDAAGTEKLLQDTISLEVQTLAYDSRESIKAYEPKVVVNTRILSKAGHRIPDG